MFIVFTTEIYVYSDHIILFFVFLLSLFLFFLDAITCAVKREKFLNFFVLLFLTPFLQVVILRRKGKTERKKAGEERRKEGKKERKKERKKKLTLKNRNRSRTP